MATAAAAVQSEGLIIPLVDLSKFLDGSPAERAATARAILDGFQTAGFVYLERHGVPADAVSRALGRSADFFNQPLNDKLRLGWTTPEANHGYVAQGRKKVTQLEDRSQVERLRSEVPDLKESFEIGRDSDPAHANRWPPDAGGLRGFRADMVPFFDRCQALHRHLMRAVALAMGLDEAYFDAFIGDADNTLRLLRYPAVEADVFRANPGQVRAGEHSDYGSITLLFQDSRGGLQVKSPSGRFVDATPIDGTIVINAGDLLARWSNDTIKSTIHRVVEPPRREAHNYPPRYSIAYFCNPNMDQFIDTLPGTYAADEDKKYKGVHCGEYLVQRLAATY